MEEVKGFLDGERDYLNLQGQTGPLVYVFFLFFSSLLFISSLFFLLCIPFCFSFIYLAPVILQGLFTCFLSCILIRLYFSHIQSATTTTIIIVWKMKKIQGDRWRKGYLFGPMHLCWFVHGFCCCCICPLFSIKSMFY